MSPPGRRRPEADGLRQAADGPQGLSASGLSPKGEYRSAQHDGRPASGTTTAGGERRRIVLMRHGSVDYFPADGTPPVASEDAALSATGRAQAAAAGALFAQCGVRFDCVVASGVARTLETAALTLAACGQAALAVEVDPALQEIRGGRLSAIPRDGLRAAFLGAFGGDDLDDGAAAAVDAESRRFLGGESVGEMLDRVLPAFGRLLARDDWHTLLLVLHGGVNRALLSHALAGGRAFFGGLEQSPACINLIDAPPPGRRGRLVVRAVNLAPTSWLHEGELDTTMERLLAQYLRAFPQG